MFFFDISKKKNTQRFLFIYIFLGQQHLGIGKILTTDLSKVYKKGFEP